MAEPVPGYHKEICLEREKMVKCPHNPLHVMTESTLQRHIVRCMVNYPDFIDCPYNALHRFPNTTALAKHLDTCSSKPYEYKDNVNSQENSSKEELVHIGHIEKIRNFNLEEEDWDKDYKILNRNQRSLELS